MPFMTTPELQAHHRHLLNSINQLEQAAPNWGPEERPRSTATFRNLKQQVAQVEAELHMAGAR